MSEVCQAKRVLIVGKGVSGMAAAQTIMERGGNVVLYDDYDFAPSSYEQTTYGALKGDCRYDYAVLSPSVAMDNHVVRLLKERGVPLLSEPDLGYLLCRGKVIAVTGTNGKTTVVRLTERLLTQAGHNAYACGNIGTPFCTVAPRLGDHDYAVVEMSSYQLEQSSHFAPDYAAITNIRVDHLERHGSMQAYIECKHKLIAKAKSGYVRDLDENLPTREDLVCYGYSLTSQKGFSYVSEGNIWVRVGDRPIPVVAVDAMPLKGEHNLKNAMCALSLATMAAGYSDRYAEVLVTYRGEPMRCERLTDTRPYIFNDSKATNVAATVCALSLMRGTTALLLGGYDKGERFVEFFETLSNDVKEVILFGASRSRLAAEAVQAGISDRIVVCEDLECAIRVAWQADVDNILFSPASSSFDAYHGYLERGKDFERLVGIICT